MKKIFSVLLIAALMSGVIAAESEAKNLSVVATIFPIYDWVRQVAGDNLSNIDLTMLLDQALDAIKAAAPAAKPAAKTGGAKKGAVEIPEGWSLI